MKQIIFSDLFEQSTIHTRGKHCIHKLSLYAEK